MKREGRQRGMVKTHPMVAAPLNPRPSLGEVVGSVPTAGLFTKVSTKPTNHSKFTGKCGRPMCRECHSSPVSKSKHKAKGAQRLKDVVGLDYLDVDDCMRDDDVDVAEQNDDDHDHTPLPQSLGNEEISHPIEECEAKTKGMIAINEEEEDEMSSCGVGLFWQQVDGN